MLARTKETPLSSLNTATRYFVFSEVNPSVEYFTQRTNYLTEPPPLTSYCVFVSMEFEKNEDFCSLNLERQSACTGLRLISIKV